MANVATTGIATHWRDTAECAARKRVSCSETLARICLLHQGSDRFQKTFRRLNCLLRLLSRDMGGDSIITHTTQFKKPVQGLALFLVQFPSLDESLVDGGNDAGVFPQLPTLAKQESRRRVEGGIICP